MSVIASSVQAERSSKVFLMTATAEVRAERRSMVRVFLDYGAQTAFVSSALVKAIKVPKVGTTQISLKGFGSAPVVTSTALRRIKLVGNDGREHEITALERSALDLNIPKIPHAVQKLWEERGVMLSDGSDSQTMDAIHVLIGADYVNLFIHEKKVVDGDVAWKTDFGWVLSGPCQTYSEETKLAQPAHVAFVQTDIQRLWELEEMPVKTLERRLWPAFPIRRKSHSYEVGLLWHSEERPDDNLQQATAAVASLVKTLQRKDQLKMYEDVILREYGEPNAIEKEPCPDSPGYYLPHHAVIRAEAVTTKVRVVFNASASMKGKKSLNAVLDPGPSLLPDLTGLILRLREYEHAVQADIRKAFFMIEVREEDRKYLRFLWPATKGQMEVYQLKKLPFGTNCSPFILNAVLSHHLQEERKSATEDVQMIIDLLQRSFYVDDCLTSLSTHEKLLFFQHVSRALLLNAGMDLRKWHGNSILGSEEVTSKVLGVHWDCNNDTLAVADNNFQRPTEWTRRSLLKCVSSIFDPLGIASPVSITGKILLQLSWKEGGDWDNPLTGSLASSVDKWWQDLSKIRAIQCNRWVGMSEGESSQLHLFTDASESAYGCCLYFLTGSHNHLIYSKAKVAPLKTHTLARLELQAAVLGSRCLQFVYRELRSKPVKVYAWTDSLTVWHWVQKPAYHWSTWVANRVAYIQQIISECNVEWRHCPGKKNPADLVSRGSSVQTLSEIKWTAGPVWLTNRSEWPQHSVGEPPEEVTRAIRHAKVSVYAVLLADQWWHRLSSWTRRVCLAARLLTWKYWKSLSRLELLKRGETLLFRIIQETLFSSELAVLRAAEKLSRTSKLCKFNPFIDEDELLRVGGRIQQSDLPFTGKHPILLGKHLLTERLIHHYHVLRKHQGVEALQTFLRHDFWIISSRRIIRKVKTACVRCRRHEAPTGNQVTPPFPKGRVSLSRPFSFCGIDYAGPLVARCQTGTCKVWIALFVCGSTRAIHLEIVTSLTTEEFLLAFRRFVARRHQPLHIISDNASTFKAASQIMAIKWEFIPPCSPWFGGF